MKRLLLIGFIFYFSFVSCDEVKEYYEARDDSKLAESKYWPSQNIPQIGVRCNLKTSWRDHKMYYIFSVESLRDFKSSVDSTYFRYNSSRFLQLFSESKLRTVLIVDFHDNSNYIILSYDIKRLTQIFDNDDLIIRLDDNNNVDCTRKKYQDMANWSVRWRYENI